MAGASKHNAKMIKLRRRIRGMSRKDVFVADAFRSSVAQAGSTDAVEDKLWNDFRGHTSRAEHTSRCLSTNRTDRRCRSDCPTRFSDMLPGVSDHEGIGSPNAEKITALADASG